MAQNQVATRNNISTSGNVSIAQGNNPISQLDASKIAAGKAEFLVQMGALGSKFNDALVKISEGFSAMRPNSPKESFSLNL